MYEGLLLPKKQKRPYFYTNFVSTLDGKVLVSKNPKAYWPIGSEADLKVFLELRHYTDAVIHGKNTALWYRTIDRFGTAEFKTKRKKAKKPETMFYIIFSNHPHSSLIPFLENPPQNVTTLLICSQKSYVPKEIQKWVEVCRFGDKEIDMKETVVHLKARGIDSALIEGGPKLLGSFIKADVVDEVFLTLTPKIFGNKEKATLTMVEDYLLLPDKVKNYKLISVKKVKNELFLRYKTKS